MGNDDGVIQTRVEREIGLLVQDLMTRKGLTQTQLAEMAGLNLKTFRRHFVSGERHMYLGYLMAVAAVLGEDAADLIRRAESAVSGAG